MRSMIKTLANGILNPMGITALKTKDLKVQLKRQGILDRLYHTMASSPPARDEASCTGIVFSRDRGMQLHALLCSYFERVENPAPLQVLFQASSPEHQSAYREVAELFGARPVQFQPQKNAGSFRRDLLSLLDRIESGKILFLVDDILFVEKFDLASFASLDTWGTVPSLRLGKNLTFCYTLQREQPLPPWSATACPEGMIRWCWRDGVLEWAYPLSLDGHLFNRTEIRIITEGFDFSAPNSYEDRLQELRELFQYRQGLAYAKSKIVNIPWNKVQGENKNISGSIHPDEFLRQWQAGMMIDYRKLYGIPNISAHQELELVLCERSKRVLPDPPSD